MTKQKEKMLKWMENENLELDQVANISHITDWVSGWRPFERGSDFRYLGFLRPGDHYNAGKHFTAHISHKLKPLCQIRLPRVSCAAANAAPIPNLAASRSLGMYRKGVPAIIPPIVSASTDESEPCGDFPTPGCSV